MTVEECERRATADYALYRGMDFVLTVVSAYWLDTDFSGDYELRPPAILRLSGSAIAHWTCQDEWLDPYWDFTFCDRHHPLAAALRSPWWFGPSYNAKTGVCVVGDLRLARTLRNRLLLWRRRKLRTGAAVIPFAGPDTPCDSKRLLSGRQRKTAQTGKE